MKIVDDNSRDMFEENIHSMTKKRLVNLFSK